jgi:hypothetical protein
MDVFEIVYPYIGLLYSDTSFAKHLEVLKITLCYNKAHNVDVENVMVQELFIANKVDS